RASGQFLSSAAARLDPVNEDRMPTTQRVLALLDLLQRRAVWTGAELAEELAVTLRSVRRDVDRLRGLGYPVESERGAGGGYRLGAGRRWAPLVLDDREAVPVAIALRRRTRAAGAHQPRPGHAGPAPGAGRGRRRVDGRRPGRGHPRPAGTAHRTGPRGARGRTGPAGLPGPRRP